MRPNVHPLPRLLAAISLAACLWTAGCSSPEDEQAAPGGSHFGAGYEIVVSEAPAAPDEPPTLRGDTLMVTVAYPGGEETHDFSLRHEVAGDTARLWLRHNAEGDDGDEHVLEDVRVQVPPEALRAPTVVLLNPQSGEPFVLRWPGEAGFRPSSALRAYSPSA